MPWEFTRTQRYLTVDFITKRRLNAPAVWLSPLSAVPSAEDAVKAPSGLGTNPNEWADEADDRNLAIRLVDGHVELHVQAPDEIWLGSLFKAFRILKVDARAAFGLSKKPVSSIILKTEGPVDPWRDRWPAPHVDKGGHWVKTSFAYSHEPTARAQPVWVDSKPLPGSLFAGDLVVWRPLGKPVADTAELGLEDLELRPLATTSMESICRGVAFATLAYWINVYLDGLEEWDSSLTRVIGGWIARVAREGQDINAHGKSLEGVCWSPVDTPDTISALLSFLSELGAKKDLGVAFLHAEAALERGAPVAGWGAIETLFGPQAKIGIRRAFRAGLDIDAVERMSEIYIYDRTTDEYLDRDDLLKGFFYAHKHDAMVARHRGERIYVGKKFLNPFELYADSSLRTDVRHREFWPGHEPGAILRFSPLHGLLNGEDQEPDEFKLLNTFPGFTIKPTASIDQAVMGPAITMIDRMLGYLTRDNDAQIKWLKQFIADIVQHPERKPQICPIIVGGQGIGKSQLGDRFMRALFGSMAGSAAADLLNDNKFVITPFVGKLVTFIDEVRLESVGAINTIKKIVRTDYLSGQFKHQNQRDYFIPSRLLIASNHPDIGLTPEDAADRCFYFIVAWTAENKKMTDREFQAWALTLKPFYDTFVAAMDSVIFRQHLMRYFTDLEVTRQELEDLQHSSRDDENVVRSTMPKAREAARAIIADARVLQGNDITSWFTSANLRDAIRRVDGVRTKVEVNQVIMEFERAGVIETIRGDLRKFKWGYGKLIQKMGEAHSLPIVPNWDYKPGDFDDNDIKSAEGGQPWRGNKQNQRQQRAAYDPDYMSSED